MIDSSIPVHCVGAAIGHIALDMGQQCEDLHSNEVKGSFWPRGFLGRYSYELISELDFSFFAASDSNG